MTLRVFNTLIFGFIVTATFGQYRLSGLVTSVDDSTAAKECVVYLNDDKRSATCDSRGRFIFEDVPNGKYTLHFVSVAYKYAKLEISVSNADKHVRVYLEP